MPASRADQAYEGLRAAIGEGRLRPGDRGRETALAAELGISRTPIREALQRLARDGLVRLDARNGARIVELSLDAIQELYDLREILEGSTARLAALGASANNLQRLNAILDRERSEEHTSELPSLMRKLYAVFCLT